MKKFFAAILAVTIMTFMTFATQVDAARLTQRDATFAFDAITQKLTWWNCTPLKIWYSGIALDDADNVKYMNELAQSHGYHKKFSACMIFYSDFISPPDPHDGKVTAWNYDSEYKNYSWYFGLYDDGEWKLLTFGY